MQIGVEARRAVENRRVFVIDDDEIARTALQFMLADDNETHEFAALADAVEKAKTHPPDLILLGAGFAGRQAKATFGAAKLLLICVNSARPNGEAARAQGIDGFVDLPLRLESVRSRVDGALGRARPLAIPVVQL